MKMKIRKNILKIVATGIATGLAFSVSCWSVAASDSTNEAKAEETQEYDALHKIYMQSILMKHRSEMLCITIMEHIGIFERMSWIIRTQDITITNRVIQKAA